jgi:hypothetical protein
MPILFLIEGLVKYQYDKYVERQNMSVAWKNEGKLLTGYAEAQERKSSTDASSRQVEVIGGSHPVYGARVSTTFHSTTAEYIEVTVNVQE